MIAAALIPLALGETWFAVFGGLIPIIGFVLLVLILWRAIRPPDDDHETRKDDEST